MSTSVAADNVVPSPVAILLPLPLTGRVGIEVEGSAAAITPADFEHSFLEHLLGDALWVCT